MNAIARTLGRTFSLKPASLRLDPAFVGIAAVFVLLAILDTPQAPKSIVFTLDALLHIFPFFALSIAVAAYAKASGAENMISQVFAGNPVRMTILAALFGALSPFCSCGVIPIISALLAAGVPLAPVMAFWLSSPLMDPEMFIISGAYLGLPFTIGKTMIAVGIGLFGGFLTMALQRGGIFTSPLKACGPATSCSSGCKKETDRSADVVWGFWSDAGRMKVFRSTSLEIGVFLGKWLTLAFVLESLMVAYIPPESITQWLGSGAWWTIPAAVIVGIPAYLNGFAAVPLMAGLIDMGMMPGAAMAFMVAGGVTSIPAAIAVYALVRRPVFLWYILLALVGASLGGGLYQLAMG